MSPLRPYVEVKCPRCGWVHAAVSLEAAMLNATSPEHRARYYRCYRCAAPTSTFVAAGPEDAPLGCTLQPVVIGEPPEKFKRHEEAGDNHAD